MKLNCTKIFFASSPGIQQSVIKRYYDTFRKYIVDFIPEGSIQNFIEQVGTDEQFSKLILQNKDSHGIYLGTSGVPQCSILNQIKGIRAAVVHTQYIAKMTRLHNDANVCIIGHQCIGEQLGGFLVRHYLQGYFDFQVKNKLRVGKLSQLEQKYLSS